MQHKKLFPKIFKNVSDPKLLNGSLHLKHNPLNLFCLTAFEHCNVRTVCEQCYLSPGNIFPWLLHK